MQITLSPLVGVRKQELRIAAQRGEELLQRAVEADLPLDGFHLRVDPVDFCEAELVDLVGRHRGRRVRGQTICVVRGAVRQVSNARRELGAVRALGFGPGDQCLVRRLEPLDQGRRCRGLQLVAACRRDLATGHQGRDFRVDVRIERRIATAAERRAGDQRTRLSEDGVVGEARRVHAFAGRELCVLERFAERAAHLADAGDVGNHVGLLVDAMEVEQSLRQERVRALHLMEHVAAPAKRPRGLGAF